MQVGHIKREQAAALAPILDDPSPLAPAIEVTVKNGGTNFFQVIHHVCVHGTVQSDMHVLVQTMDRGRYAQA
jgi:hypothetical protein